MATGRKLRDERGFTLVELAVAMPIMLIVMGGLVIMLTTLTHSSSQSQEETALQSEARSALTTMEMELRGAFTGGDGSPVIAAATATSITFYSPDETAADPNTAVSFHLREISYQVSNGLLQRQFRTSTNQYPNASCLSCGGSTQWTWGAWSPWVTVVGATQGTILNVANSCKPSKASIPAGVFCFYDGTDILNPTLLNPQTTVGWSASNGTYPWKPQTFPISDTSGITSVIVTLQLSSGGSQPVNFTVSDTMTIRGAS